MRIDIIRGRWVLYLGGEFVGIFPSRRAAFRHGIETLCRMLGGEK